MPLLSLRALLALIKQERRWLEGIEKHDILEKASYVCSACGSKTALEFDHVHRLSDSVGAQEFQPLCRDCHQEKH